MNEQGTSGYRALVSVCFKYGFCKVSVCVNIQNLKIKYK